MKKIKRYFALLPILLGIMAVANVSFADKQDGEVYFYNFKPEAHEAWLELTELYTERTGVSVRVETKTSGYYADNLEQEFQKKNPPTLFQLAPAFLEGKEKYCLNLAETDFYKELNNKEFTLNDKFGRVCGIAYAIECYGIIVNRNLLEKAGYDTEEIKSLSDLKKVAEDITARKSELGFSAFCSAGMSESSDWRFKTHLANMPIYFEYQAKSEKKSKAISDMYMSNYKELWDLFINNSTCNPAELSKKTIVDARKEFCEGKAVFYMNGSWDYVNLIEGGMNKYNMVMIPLYFGTGNEDNQGLCTGTENYWCVNRKASKKDIKATLDFITWCVTSKEGTTAMAQRMGFAIPFRNAAYSENIFIQQNAINNAKGKTAVTWDFTTIPSDDWKTALGNALTAYAANQTEENWREVVLAFVDNWAKEYKKKNR